jgi:hypothetical protein
VPTVQRLSGGLLAVLVAATAARAPGQDAAALDTVLAVRGIVQLRTDRANSAGVWIVFLPTPMQVGPLRTNAVELAGSRRDAERYADRFVEARGRVTLGRDDRGALRAVMAASRLREMRPEGTVERAVDLSMSQHASVLLSIVPRRVVWRDSAGTVTGTTPTVLFSIVNHSQTPLQFSFPTNEVVCVSVKPEYGGRGKETAWRVLGAQTLIVLRMGTIFRQIVALPDSTAAWPGRYTIRASLCGADEFHAEGELEVAAP